MPESGVWTSECGTSTIAPRGNRLRGTRGNLPSAGQGGQTGFPAARRNVLVRRDSMILAVAGACSFVPMPEISRFFGIVVAMYYDDHRPPHVHVRYAEYRAILPI